MVVSDRFFIAEETVRVNLGDGGGAWVDIKKEMSIGDWDRFEADTISLIPGEDGVAATRGYFHRSEITLMELNIVAWSFDRPITRENISKLRRPVADLIIAEIDKLNISPNERRAARRASK